MKRFTYAMVMAVALVVLVSSFAVAGDGCKSKASAEKVSMSDCCIKAAKADEGCCGKDADTVKASYAAYSAGCSTAEKAACSSSATVKTASAKASCSTAEKAACATSASAKAACSTAEKAACATSASAKASCSEAEKAACSTDKAAYKAASADMHECCATAVAEGKGCCGKDADVLQASYEEKVAYYKASASVTADMHECCATALSEGKGCCGQSADEMKTDFDKKVSEESKKVASS